MGDEIILILRALTHRRNIANFSLLCRYSHSMCSDELPALTFATGACHAKYTRVNHLHSLRIPLVNSKFHLDSFPKTDCFRNRLPTECSPNHSNLDFFKYNVNLHKPINFTCVFLLSYNASYRPSTWSYR